MALRFHEKAAMQVLSVAWPSRLAKLLLRPYPQPMVGALETTGHVERIEFEAPGGLVLRGWWIWPAGAEGLADRCVVLAHGWSSHGLRMQALVEPLLALGYPVMIYHARSHGDSDPFPICSLAQFTEDVHAATAYARSRVSHVVVLGHSLGGAGALVAAADGAPMDAVISLAAPAHPAQGSIDILRAQGVDAERIFQRVAPYVSPKIGRSLESIAPELRIGEVKCPVLLLHGTADRAIPFAHFERISRAAGANVERHPVPGAGHDHVKAAPVTLEQVRRFLPRVF